MPSNYEDALMEELDKEPDQHQYQAIIKHDEEGQESVICETVTSSFSSPKAVAKMLVWRYPLATSIEVKEL